MKSKSSANKGKSGVPQMEYSGHWISGNIWFKLGFSKEEAEMFKAIGADLFEKKVKSAYIARIVLQAALAHYDALKPLMLRDAQYAEDEGFSMLDSYMNGLVNQQRAKLVEMHKKSTKRKGKRK